MDPNESFRFSQNFWPLLDWKIFSHVDFENLLSTFNVVSKIRNPKVLNLDGISKQNQTKEQNEDSSFLSARGEPERF